jgi:hypothetical protein
MNENPRFIDENDETLFVALILEIRGTHLDDVWVRVEWLYRPNQLPMGRQEYHGKNELIRCRDQDIISALTVAGHADVTHWKEGDNSHDIDGIEGLFWRQTLVGSTHLTVYPLSKLQ